MRKESGSELGLERTPRANAIVVLICLVSAIAHPGCSRPGRPAIATLFLLLKVQKNYMFIGSPGDSFPHHIAELGGVRVIL